MKWIVLDLLARVSLDSPKGTIATNKGQLRPAKSLMSSFLASGVTCRLLIAFANSLVPNQDRRSVGPDLDPKRLSL